MKKLTKLLAFMFFLFTCSCAGLFQSGAVQRVESETGCVATVSNVIAGGGDDGLDAYDMLVCGQRRRYAYINNPHQGSYAQITDITNGRPGRCEMMVTSQREHILRLFYVSGYDGASCVDHYISQGWRILSTRRAHNGNTSTGWGEEVTLTR